MHCKQKSINHADFATVCVVHDWATCFSGKITTFERRQKHMKLSYSDTFRDESKHSNVAADLPAIAVSPMWLNQL